MRLLLSAVNFGEGGQMPGYLQRLLLLSACWISTLLVPAVAKADWLNLTGAETSRNIAEIYILDDHVRVQLEIYPDDLEVFRELIPSEWTEQLNIQRPSLQARQELFSRQTLVIKDEQGDVLQAQFRLIEPRTRIDRQSPFAGMINPYTQRRIPGAPVDKRVVFAEIIYPFSKSPGQLTITPPLDENGAPRATLGFIAYHKSVPIVDFRYLGREETLNLDWKDPWYTQFENRNLTRHHRYPMMLFLYVEPRRVRFESLMRVIDISEMVGFESVASTDNAAMHEALREKIIAFLSQKGSLNIDDASSYPDDISVGYFTIGVSGLVPIEDPSSVDDASLLVGISRHYYVSSLPQTVRTEWSYFNPRIDQIPLTETDPAGPLPGFVYEEDPEIGWRNLLKTWEEPVLKPLEVNTGWRINIPLIGETTLFNELPEQAQAKEIVSGLFENIRVSYIEKETTAFSAAMSRVTTDNRPEGLVTELSKLFAPEMKRGGNGEIRRFDDFTIDAMDELENPHGFRATISGTAWVQAMHWGHTDQLQLQYQALADLVEEDGQWRLADLTFIDLKAL